MKHGRHGPWKQFLGSFGNRFNILSGILNKKKFKLSLMNKRVKLCRQKIYFIFPS